MTWGLCIDYCAQFSESVVIINIIINYVGIKLHYILISQINYLMINKYF